MGKMGVQSQSGIIQSASALLACKPAAYLLLGNAASVDFARKIRAESPSTLILLRAQPDNWALDLAWTNDFAIRSMRAAAPFQAADCIDFLLPPNEPVVRTPDEAQLLSALMVNVARIYVENGFATGAYTFPVGNPPYELWPYLKDGINASDGWLFLHEYGAPALQSGAADLSLRHRNVLGRLSGIPKLKIGITECGIDLGIVGKGGGYRALPDNGHLIEDYLSQLTWWSSELAKDSYVKFATLFGYAMEHPWETFDLAAVDTDRSAFIQWLGTQPPTPQPTGDGMSTAKEKINGAWGSLGIPFNPDAAFPKIAKQLGLGRPVAKEYRYIGADGVSYAGQAFDAAFLESLSSDVLSAKPYDYSTGEAWVPPTTQPPNPNPPPTTAKRQTTADMPVGFGFSVESYVPKAGEQFWGLVSNGGWKLGQGTQILVQTLGLNGVPQFDVPVTHAYDPQRIKSETFPTDGTGQAHFIEGAGNDFTPPAPPPDQFYVSVNDGIDGAKWPTRKGDVVHMGQVGGHTEGTLVFQLMVG